MLFNTDRFLLASGHRNYFYQQKDYYTGELDRISDLFNKSRYREIDLSKKYKEVKENMQYETERFEKEIRFLREKVNYFFLFINNKKKIFNN